MEHKNNPNSTLPHGIFKYDKELIKNNKNILQVELNFRYNCNFTLYNFIGYYNNNNLLIHYNKSVPGPFSMDNYLKPDYEKMMNYILESKLVITDSGGLVREAYFAKKKSLFILEHPVWPEIIEQGYCLNAPPNKSKILNAYKNLLKPIRKFKKNIFGNGKASSLIVSQINKYLN